MLAVDLFDTSHSIATEDVTGTRYRLQVAFHSLLDALFHVTAFFKANFTLIQYLSGDNTASSSFPTSGLKLAH